MTTTISRRSLLAASGIGAAALVTGLGTQLAVAQDGEVKGDKLVVLMLSGGADPLVLAPPVSMSSYYDRRRNIAIQPPGENGGALPLTAASANGNAIFPSGFDGVFGLHPALQPLYGTWQAGNMALVTGVGLPGITRSHFRAIPKITAGSMEEVQGGWIGRLMSAKGNAGGTPLQAVTAPGAGDFAAGLSTHAGIIGNLDQFGISGFANASLATAALRATHARNDSISVQGTRLIGMLDSIQSISSDLRPGYPNTDTGRQFSELAALLQSDLGIEAAAIENGGWDMHANLTSRMSRFGVSMAEAVGAFIDDTGLEGITLMMITEFGRTIGQNGRGGTDHGHGFTAFVMGEGIQGGVFGEFPDDLSTAREIPITTDYRKVISEVATNRLEVGNLNGVFPGLTQSGAFGLTR